MDLRTLFRKWTFTATALIAAVVFVPFFIDDLLIYLGGLAVTLILTVPIDHSRRNEV